MARTGRDGFARHQIESHRVRKCVRIPTVYDFIPDTLDLSQFAHRIELANIRWRFGLVPPPRLHVDLQRLPEFLAFLQKSVDGIDVVGLPPGQVAMSEATHGAIEPFAV